MASIGKRKNSVSSDSENSVEPKHVETKVNGSDLEESSQRLKLTGECDLDALSTPHTEWAGNNLWTERNKECRIAEMHEITCMQIVNDRMDLCPGNLMDDIEHNLEHISEAETFEFDAQSERTNASQPGSHVGRPPRWTESRKRLKELPANLHMAQNALIKLGESAGNRMTDRKALPVKGNANESAARPRASVGVPGQSALTGTEAEESASATVSCKLLVKPSANTNSGTCQSSAKGSTNKRTRNNQLPRTVWRQKVSDLLNAVKQVNEDETNRRNCSKQCEETSVVADEGTASLVCQVCGGELREHSKALAARVQSAWSCVRKELKDELRCSCLPSFLACTACDLVKEREEEERMEKGLSPPCIARELKCSCCSCTPSLGSARKEEKEETEETEQMKRRDESAKEEASSTLSPVPASLNCNPLFPTPSPCSTFSSVSFVLSPSSPSIPLTTSPASPYSPCPSSYICPSPSASMVSLPYPCLLFLPFPSYAPLPALSSLSHSLPLHSLSASPADSLTRTLPHCCPLPSLSCSLTACPCPLPCQSLVPSPPYLPRPTYVSGQNLCSPPLVHCVARSFVAPPFCPP